MFQVSTTSFHAPRSLFRKLNMALFNRTARLHTRQYWLKTELLPTDVNSLLKMYGLRPRVTSTLWGLCLNTTSHFNSSRRTPMSSRKFCSWYMGPATSCHRTRSTKPYWAFRKDFGLCASWWWMIIPCRIEHINYGIEWYRLTIATKFHVGEVVFPGSQPYAPANGSGAPALQCSFWDPYVCS